MALERRLKLMELEECPELDCGARVGVSRVSVGPARWGGRQIRIRSLSRSKSQLFILTAIAADRQIRPGDGNSEFGLRVYDERRAGT